MSAVYPKVVFVRHGESEWNRKNLFCGWYDAELSDKGKQDAVEISAKALLAMGFKFDVAFTSCLTRANQTLQMILRELNQETVPVKQHWRLNERHYGALTGFNKREMAEVYGDEQVQVWRRSYNVPPPKFTERNPHYEAIRFNEKFRGIPNFPDTETLESTMKRVVSYWDECIVPEVRDGKRVLIVAHGTSLRGLIKHIEDLSKEQIMKLNLPNSIPFFYEFNMADMKPIGNIKFLADNETLLQAMDKVASIGSKAE